MREFPEPVVTYDFYPCFIAVHGILNQPGISPSELIKKQQEFQEKNPESESSFIIINNNTNSNNNNNNSNNTNTAEENNINNSNMNNINGIDYRNTFEFKAGLIISKLRDVCKMLERRNILLLKYLLDFLGILADHAGDTRMGISNLAMIFGPIFIRSSEQYSVIFHSI